MKSGQWYTPLTYRNSPRLWRSLGAISPCRVEPCAAFRSFATQPALDMATPRFSETVSTPLRREKIDGATLVDPWEVNVGSDRCLVKRAKNITKFIRFLRIWCDEAGKGPTWAEFVRRHCGSSGAAQENPNMLMVEHDAYLTRDEVVTEMLENGYEFSRVDAIATFFSHEDKFHYPELAVLFDVSDSDAFSFCLRQRTLNGTILDLSGVDQGGPPLLSVEEKSRPSLVRSYALTYCSLSFIFATAPISAYVWCGKMIPAFLVYYFIFYQGLGRSIDAAMRGMARMSAESAAISVLEGEERIVSKVRDFAGDGDCLNAIDRYPSTVRAHLREYWAALVAQKRHDMESALLRQLATVRQAEASATSRILTVLVTDLFRACRERARTSGDISEIALRGAVEQLSKDSAQKVQANGRTTGQKLVESILREMRSTQGTALSKQAEEAFSRARTELDASLGLSRREADIIRTTDQKSESANELQNVYRSVLLRVGMAPIEDALASYTLPVAGEPKAVPPGAMNSLKSAQQLTQQLSLRALKQRVAS